MSPPKRGSGVPRAHDGVPLRAEPAVPDLDAAHGVQAAEQARRKAEAEAKAAAAEQARRKAEAEAKAEATRDAEAAILASNPWLLMPAWWQMQLALLSRPAELIGAGLRFGGQIALGLAGVAAWTIGTESPPARELATEDAGFADDAWAGNPWYFGQRQLYLAWSNLVRELVTVDLDEDVSVQANLAAGLVVEAPALP